MKAKAILEKGNGAIPVWHEAHRYETGTHILKKGIFFDHWHTSKHLGHCLYGSPYINL